MEELKKLNEEYVKLKNKQEALQKKINELDRDLTKWEEKKEEAKNNGDVALEQQAKDEVKKIEKELERKKAKWEDLKGKINERVEKAKDIPEMREKLDKELSKRYDRKKKKAEKEKAELVSKKSKAETLKQLITEHPKLANYLKGVLVAQKSIKDLNKELKGLEILDKDGKLQGYTDSIKAKEIQTKLLPDAQAKLTVNKAPLMQYITKKKLDITEQDIDELIDSIKCNKKGEVDLSTTMDARIKSLNRNIKGCDKSIKDYGFARCSCGDSKPKWWQFGKRWKQWREEVKRKKLPTPEQADKSKNSNFKNSFKYAIISPVLDKYEDEDLKYAKQNRKETSREDRE